MPIALRHFRTLLRHSALLLLLGPPLSGGAQTYPWNWAKTLGGTPSSGDDAANDVAFDPNDQSLYAVGAVDGTNPLNTGMALTAQDQAFLCKYNDAGSLQWQVQIGDGGEDKATGVAVSDDGTVYVVGTFTGSAQFFTSGSVTAILSSLSSGGTDIFLAAYDPTGGFLWAYTISGPDDQDMPSVAVDATGIVVAGRTKGYATANGALLSSRNTPGTLQLWFSNDENVFLARYAPNGTIQWMNTARSTGNGDDLVANVASNGSFIVTGLRAAGPTVEWWQPLSMVHSSSSGTENDTYITAFELDGTHRWTRPLTNTSPTDLGTPSVNMACQGVYVTGQCNGTTSFAPLTGPSGSPTDNYFYLAKLSETAGTPLQATFGASQTSNEFIGRDIAVSPNGAVLVCGSFKGNVNVGASTLSGTGNADNFVLTFRPSGQLIAHQAVLSTGSAICGAIATSRTGGLALAGTYDSDLVFGAASLTSLGGDDGFIAFANMGLRFAGLQDPSIWRNLPSGTCAGNTVDLSSLLYQPTVTYADAFSPSMSGVGNAAGALGASDAAYATLTGATATLVLDLTDTVPAGELLQVRFRRNGMSAGPTPVLNISVGMTAAGPWVACGSVNTSNAFMTWKTVATTAQGRFVRLQQTAGSTAGDVDCVKSMFGSYDFGTWTVSNGTLVGTQWTAPIASGTVSLTYTVPTNSGGCTKSTTKPVTVQAPSLGGTLTSNSPVCPGGTVDLVLTGHQGSSLDWMASPDGVSWTNVVNNTATHSINNLTGDLQVAVRVTNGACPSAMSNTLTVGTADTQAPDLVMPNDTTLYVSATNCTVQFNYMVSATDNCGCVAPPTPVGSLYIGTMNGSNYYLFTNPTTRDAAHVQALSMGGHLACIGSATENQFLADAGDANGFSDWWIGLNDEATEGTFVWPNGEPMVFDAWLASEPSDTDGTADGVVQSSSGWNDKNVGEQLPYMVEVPCGNLTISWNAGPLSGSLLGPGTYDIAWKAEDGWNNTLDTFTVTVLDTVPPVFSNCPGNDTLVLAGHDCTLGYVFPVIHSTDGNGCDPDTEAEYETYVLMHDSSTYLDVSGWANITLSRGTHRFREVHRDDHWNSAACEWQVVVVDSMYPEITCALTDSFHVYLGAGCQVAFPDLTTYVTATDCNGATIDMEPDAFTMFYGDTLVNMTMWVSDSLGNGTWNNHTIWIHNDAPPTIVCPNDTVLQADPLTCSAQLLAEPLAVNGICGAVWTSSIPSGTYPPGEYTITLTATGGGNSDACTYTVLVRDTLVHCSGAISFTATNAGDCTTSVLLPPQDSTTVDLCGPLTWAGATHSDGAWAVNDTTAVTYKVIDAAGIPHYCVFDVVTMGTGLPDLAYPTTVCTNEGTVAPTNSMPLNGVTYTCINCAGLVSSDGSFDPAVLGPGTWTIAVDAPCFSPEADTATVTVVASPDPSPGNYGPVCSQNGAFTLNGTPVGGTWIGTGVTGNTFDPSVAGPGSHTIGYVSTGVGGCTATASTIIVVNPTPSVPVISASGPTTFCDGGSVTLTSSSATGNLWSNGATAQSISATASGNYSVTVTDGNGCSATSTALSTTATPVPTASVSYPGSAFCTEGTLVTPTISGTASGTFSADPTISTLDAWTGSFLPGSTTATNYTIKYKWSATGGCPEDSIMMPIEVHDAVWSGNNGDTSLCMSATWFDLNTLITSGANPGGTWKKSTGLVLPGGIVDPSVATPGTYTYWYITHGTPPCTDDTAAFSITYVAVPNAGSDGALNIVCSDAPVSLFDQLGGTPSPGGNWSGPSTVIGNAFDPATMQDGTYTYSVQAGAPCSSVSAEVMVSVAQPTVTLQYASNTFCKDGSTVFPTVASPMVLGAEFLASAGVAIDASTGAIDLGSSDVGGPYPIGYVIGDGCVNSGWFWLTITAPGVCGCGVPGTDTDTDGTADCVDGCPADPNKIAPGTCGCGVADTDTDGDGNADCIDTCDNSTDGQACDDNDPCTINDVLANCVCAGTPAGDSDGDTICDPIDTCDNSTDGQACDDNDPCTVNDVLTNCVCAGTPAGDSDGDTICDPIDTCDNSTDGQACDDNDPCTINDVLANCVCAGTPAGDSDGDTICDPIDTCDNSTDGQACNDNDPCTINDVLANCVCAGTPAGDSDGDTICDPIDTCDNSTDGQACDDNDPCTINDVLTNCVCAGTPAGDSDGDMICDPIDTCDNSTDGTACNDNDPCTINDVLTNCVCAGTTDNTDSDGDGTANCNDGCPNDPDKIAPGICGCGVSDVDTDNDGVADCVDACPSGISGSSTTASDCSSYFWSISGQTYNQSGTYFHTVGCNTDTLVLTIAGTTGSSTTASDCSSYFWSISGQTYNQSGTYFHTVGCNTDTLVLTIAGTTGSSTTASDCNSYFWSISGQTYNQSGTYFHTVGCNTDTLVLTIAGTTGSSTTASDCNSYFWSISGQTYNQSGTYFHTVGCNTDTLLLTIDGTTGSSTTASDCNSYFWSTSGQTYTGSGTFTHTVGCNTDTLVLTIAGTTGSSTTASDCSSYFWSISGQTYNQSGTYFHTVGCNTDTLVLTIAGTTGSSTTASDCNSYFWSISGQPYNQSGTYFHSVGCNTDTLVLTIAGTTGSSTTASDCNSYFWSISGQTYNQSGTYFHSVGCNTDTLLLTIDGTTGSSTTASYCSSYFWSISGQTYNQSGSYFHTAGCNTDTLVLTINGVTGTSTSASDCNNYFWSISGQTYTASGTYTHTIGCNTDTLVLTINGATGTSTSASDCNNYFWSISGQTYTASGTYTHTIGCNTDTLVLTINGATGTSTSASDCNSYFWSISGQTYTASGTYTHTVGCNTDTLVLTINGATGTSTSASDCNNYFWSISGQTYTASGTYTHTIGCNTDTLVLTINGATGTSTSASDCNSYFWSISGQTYTASGTYTHTVGCNTDTLVLTINGATGTSTSASDCNSYFWSTSGQTYTASGTYTHTIGCNTDTLVLTINGATGTSTSASDCNSYFWSISGQTYTASGTYTHTVGCNTDTLVLTINGATGTSTSASDCNSYFWSTSGQTYTASGTYTHTVGCNTDTLVLTITGTTGSSTTDSDCNSYFWSTSGQTYNQSGTYFHTVGCNTDTLMLTIGGTPDATFFYSNSTFCQNGFDPITNPVTPGGAFTSAPTTLVMDALGTIDLDASPLGTYSVLYTVEVGGCTGVHTESITIDTVPAADWTSPGSVCDGVAPLDLNTLLNNGSATGGTWSGTGVIGNMFNPSGMLGLVELTYTATLGNCSSNGIGYVNITPAPVANAGPDAEVCGLEHQMAATLQTAVGIWTSLTGGTIADTYSPSTMVGGISGVHHFLWTVGDGQCYSADSVQITFQDPAVVPTVDAGPDQHLDVIDHTVLQGTTDGTAWLWSLASGSGNITDPAMLVSEVYLLGLGANTFILSASNGPCPAVSDTVLITVNELSIPTGFSPNGDGVNDALVIPGITEYPESRIAVFDRWGRKVYEGEGYRNDWTGRELPDDTYFMVLNITEGRTYDGYLIIKR
ncbi:MAG: gliding motility-associated C-terminal domain-containing protein [Flavobacteriales bacterium]|nr:MAG: gliding motility-associated C-terminal domain-containing protein [Flavobacteriales bacterium]